MGWKMQNRRGGDEGFTLAEVLIAVTIFFIAFASVMSLMLSIINTNVEAREKASLTNAANTYIERVRNMNYNLVGTSVSPPYGSLAATSTVANGYTIAITPTVTWVDDPTMSGAQDYKRIVLNVTGTKPGAPTLRYSAETIVKKPDSGVNPNAVAPTINFTAGSPNDRELVEGSSVSIGAVASANGANVTLTSMNFYCDGVPLQNSFGNTAQWPLNATGKTQTFLWDTEAKNEDGVDLSIDGWHTIKIEVWDSNGKQAFSQRIVLVDNDDPNAPASITAVNVAGSNQLQVSWPTATDGNTTADHYLLTRWQQGATATGTSDKTGWAATTGSFSVNSVLFGPAPLSRYCFEVKASNPTGSRVSTPVECIAVSRPQLTGTWRNNLTYDAKKDSGDKYTSTHTFALSTPTFPYSSITNTLYRSTSPAMTSRSRSRAVAASPTRTRRLRAPAAPLSTTTRWSP